MAEGGRFPPKALRSRQAWAQALIFLGLVVAAGLVGGGLGRLVPGPEPEPILPQPEVMVAQPERIPDEVVVSDQEKAPESTPPLLPAEAQQLYCAYRFEQYPRETPLQVSWRRQGHDLGELKLESHRQARGEILAGRFTIKLPEEKKQFAPGIYQLIFRSGAKTVAEASFVLAEGAQEILAQQPPPAGEIRVIKVGTFRGLDPQGKPLEPSRHFGPKDRIYVVFTYLNGVKDARFEVHWLSRSIVIPQATQQVEMKAGAGQAYAWLEAQGGGLPEGNYQVQVLRAGSEQPLATAQFMVGKGVTVPPPPVPATSGE